MKRLVLAVFDYFAGHRAAFWLVMAGTFALFTVPALRITFEEDISKMLQLDEQTREYRKLVQNTRIVDKLVLCISDKSGRHSPEKVKMDFCDSLAARLGTLDTGLVRKVTASPEDLSLVDVYRVILKNLPFFMEERDYLGTDSLLQPGNLRKRLEGEIRLLSSPAGFMVRQGLSYDPAGISGPVAGRLQKLGQSTGFEVSGGYFFSRDKKSLLLFVEPASPSSETGRNKVLMKKIDGFIRTLGSREEFNGLECGYTGATAMAVGNARQIQRDTAVTLALMCMILVLLITSVFRKKRTPVLIFLPLIFGILFALACISFIKPGISLIAIGATSVLLGIAVNYPLHILTHRLHEQDLRKVIAGMVEPMTIGSATTIGGFVCLLFVKAEILRDFGLLGAFGLTGAVLFSLLFLPHLVGGYIYEKPPAEKWLEKAGRALPDRNPYLRWAMILLTPVLFWFAGDVEFDTDLMHLNYTPPGIRKTEKKLQGADSLRHPVYIISYGKTMDAALASAGRIKQFSDSLNRAGIINQYTGVAGFLPSAAMQQERARRWREYFTYEKQKAVLAALDGIARQLGFREEAFSDFRSLISMDKDSIPREDFKVLAEAFGREPVTVGREMTTVVSVLRIPFASRTDIDRLISRQANARLLDNKLLSSQLGSIINDDFNFIAVFTALLVFIALVFTYGRVELAFTAFIPMVVSWIWILGLMGLFHVKFNLVNIILSSFIFGLGDDYCIFMMDGLLQQFRKKTQPLPVIRMSILLSGLTTLTGFGVMVVARHPALKSISLVSVIGIGSVLMISQVLEPWLFNLFVTGPVSRRKPPVTVAGLIVKALEFLAKGPVPLFVRKQEAVSGGSVPDPEQAGKRLRNNFLFMGFRAEQKLRRELRNEGNYRVYHELVPQKGDILEVGCGHGFLSYMLAYRSPERKVTGIDPDPEKTGIATNGFDRPANLSFETMDFGGNLSSAYDCVILSGPGGSDMPGDPVKFLARCGQSLKAGGRMIIRHAWNDRENRPGRGPWPDTFLALLASENPVPGLRSDLDAARENMEDSGRRDISSVKSSNNELNCQIFRKLSSE